MKMPERLTNGSKGGGSPHVHRTDDRYQVLVQGYRVDHGLTDVPEHEDVVKIPALLLVDTVIALAGGKVNNDDLYRLLALPSESWFRLETLETYDEPGEAEEVAHWLATGELHKDPERTSWEAMLQDHLDAAHTLRRVSFVYGALNDYTRWKVSSQLSRGEDIRIVDVTANPEVADGAFDFWLLDDRVGVRQLYNERPRWIGAERLTDADIEVCRRLRDRAWAASVPAAEYLARERVP